MYSRSVISTYLCVILLLPGTAAVLQAAPENDDYADAAVLEGLSGHWTGDNRGASRELGEELHAGNAGGSSVWFRWTAVFTGRLTVYTFGSDFDTLLASYTGETIGNTVFLESNDDSWDDFQSRIVFPVTQGQEYRIAVDGWNGNVGNILLTWHLSRSGGAPANDTFSAAWELDGPAGMEIGSNTGSSREEEEPYHLGQIPGRSVWYTWTPANDGEASFSTDGSGFDTLLAVYTGDSVDALERITQNDDVDEVGTPGFSRVRFRVSAGVPYHLVVDGQNEDIGVFILRWVFSIPCDPPSRPEAPVPGDTSVEVGRRLTLQWNQARQVAARIVYGEDGRMEAYAVIQEDRREALESIAMVVDRAELAENPDGTFSLPARTLGETASFCETERFVDQPNPGICSAFLVGPDLLATSGQCLSDDSDCGRFAFVFGCRMERPGVPILDFDASQVYFCEGILQNRVEGQGADWAVVRVDREVDGREPFAVRREGEVEEGQELLAMGHPFGLPLKVSDGAVVRDARQPEIFVASIDAAYGGPGRGSSGSPVLDARTLLVEGILVRGEEDVIEENGCFVSLRCGDEVCRGEDVTRAAEFQHLVPPNLDNVIYEVWMGSCGGLTKIGETSSTSWELEERLDRATPYCWRIVARNECGRVFGPSWSFVTTAALDPVFRRGDVNQDELANLSDAIGILNYLFLEGDTPGCLNTADVDDSGQVDITDGVYLLNYLFIGGAPPAEPLAACDIDVTPDVGLGCEFYTPCGF